MKCEKKGNVKKGLYKQRFQKKINDAQAGFLKKGRIQYRKEVGVSTSTDVLPTQKKNEHTCLEDAVYNALLALGENVNLDGVRSMYNRTTNTPFPVATEFLHKNYKRTMSRVTKEFLLKGGIPFSILQQKNGLFILQLAITYNNEDKEPDFHCVFYNATKGCILDNQQNSKVVYIEDSDRISVQAARDVFGAVARNFKVQIQNVYKIS